MIFSLENIMRYYHDIYQRYISLIFSCQPCLSCSVIATQEQYRVQWSSDYQIRSSAKYTLFSNKRTMKHLTVHFQQPVLTYTTPRTAWLDFTRDRNSRTHTHTYTHTAIRHCCLVEVPVSQSADQSCYAVITAAHSTV